ncbi:cysteine proteinase [Cristinia sonorae]|uniref:ubiquitinyl hydrolase 1 n=1 Tax=Cristinia sonorae TaxID=1940300 RepID=A0A8K0V0J0_9AGAR|nr:cysteine proteinase [Cristinia sonorae]
MPPKRLRRRSPSDSAPMAGERFKRAKLAGSDYSAWGWVGSEVTDVSEISQYHRLAACGFSANGSYPLCTNKYADTTPPSPSKQNTNRKVIHGELEDDIIVISDDEGLSCDSKTCRNNPYCLNHLGQDKWEDEDRALSAFMKRSNLGENPIYLARDPGSPIGLKNLGATCYANAFLQVWFQDLAFRRGVYQCQPPQESTQQFEESPIFQLQVTFAAMQESTQNTFNPVKLVESLKLRTTEQQDAQEFSKLFMAHLDSEFQKQSIPGLKSLLADQFQGKQVYGTLCSSCKTRSERESEFLEVEVNIPKNNAKLEDRLSALLQPEELSGDNKYFCSVCNELRDAQRYTEFRELPPVLHVSLLRFVFDLQTMERKKSKNAISFPLTLDMNPFLGPPNSRKITNDQGKNHIYHLRGVLLHKGSSAYHGHYEAQVFDVQNKSWYQFNDETVTKMESLFPTLKSAAPKDKPLPSSHRGRTKKKTRIDDSDLEILEYVVHVTPYVSSKDAYMLVYARENASDKQSPAGPSSTKPLNVISGCSTSPTHSVIPQRALEVVNAMNGEYDKACDEYGEKENEVKRQFERKRRIVMDIYRSWSLLIVVQDSSVVSRQALEAWLGRHLAKPPKPSEGSKGKQKNLLTLSEDGEGCTISNEDITCEHGSLDPGKASDMKQIRKSASQRILEQDRAEFSLMLEPINVCDQCTRNAFSERLYQIQHPRIVSHFDAVGQVEDEDQLSHWISKAWLKDWRLNKPKMHESSRPDPPPDDPEFAKHVRCEHGGLTTNTSTRKRVSPEGFKILKELFPDWTTLTSDDEVCAVCQALLHISKEDKREIRRQAEDEKAKLKHMYEMTTMNPTIPVVGEPCAMIPAQFLRSWKQWLFRPTELQRPQGIDNTIFLCEHGDLIIDPNDPADIEHDVALIQRRDYEVLEDLYPCGPLIQVESHGDDLSHVIPVCAECRRARKSSFETTEIVVRVLRPSDPVPTPETYTEDDPVPDEPRGKKPFPITYGSRKVNGLRQSKRIQQSSGQVKRRKVTITRDMTVKELKMRLHDELNIPTIYQRLFHRGQEIEDNAASLVSFGVISNDVLDLREEAEDVDLIGSGDEETRKPADEGRAFGGTLLGGGDISETRNTTISSSSSRQESPALEPLEKSCPACTFVNPLDVLACTICDTVFYTDS